MRHQKNARLLNGFRYCFSLITLYQKSVASLLQLADQAAQAQADAESITLTAGKNSRKECCYPSKRSPWH